MKQNNIHNNIYLNEYLTKGIEYFGWFFRKSMQSQSNIQQAPFWI